MPDAVEFLNTIKKASVEAVEAAKPVNICFGVVESTSPLIIRLEQKLVLGEAQTILTRNVKDYVVKITENADETAMGGEKEVTVHNGLANGEKVILFRKQGGQKYIVWDRIE